MNYPHRIVITRPRADGSGAGTQDRTTGAWMPAATAAARDVVIYDGGADVQDRGQVLDRDVTGRPSLTSDASAYLEDTSVIPRVRDDDLVTIYWQDGSTGAAAVADARVMRAERLGGVLYLRRV